MKSGSNTVSKKERKVYLPNPRFTGFDSCNITRNSSQLKHSTFSTRQYDVEWCTARTIEAQDQAEFYRCSNKTAGRCVPVITE
ncbi:uncharacterized protein BDW70DRAFT_141882 [Aspergillus foveolatus]|uniref:uncharacterized protein n=1 Tax=Aspergillus foveolatus TaxID=210207 RepID=UPI003CCD38CA